MHGDLELCRGGGTTSSTVYFGGGPGAPLEGLTEEWADPVLAVKTVTTS